MVLNKFSRGRNFLEKYYLEAMKRSFPKPDSITGIIVIFGLMKTLMSYVTEIFKIAGVAMCIVRSKTFGSSAFIFMIKI